MPDTKIEPISGRNIGDNIAGDRIYVRCRKPSEWKLYRMTNTHKGHQTTAQKNAYAEIEQAYKNLQK